MLSGNSRKGSARRTPSAVLGDAQMGAMWSLQSVQSIYRRWAIEAVQHRCRVEGKSSSAWPSISFLMSHFYLDTQPHSTSSHLRAIVARGNWNTVEEESAQLKFLASGRMILLDDGIVATLRPETPPALEGLTTVCSSARQQHVNASV